MNTDTITRLTQLQVPTPGPDLEAIESRYRRYRRRRRGLQAAMATAAVAAITFGAFSLQRPVTPTIDAVGLSPGSGWPASQVAVLTFDRGRSPGADARGELPLDDVPVMGDVDGGKTSTQVVAGTSFGQPGTMLLRGPRTIYGAPLFALDEVRRGDQVRVRTADGATFVYVVSEITTIGQDDDPTALAGEGGSWLVVTTPDPLFTTSRQVVVVANIAGRSDEQGGIAHHGCEATIRDRWTCLAPGERPHLPRDGLTDLAGQLIPTDALRSEGSMTLLTIVADWCVPCRSQQEDLEGSVPQRLGDAGWAHIIALGAPDRALAYAEELALPGPVGVDVDGSFADQVLELLDVPGSVVPVTVVLDGDGGVAAWTVGVTTADDVAMVLAP